MSEAVTDAQVGSATVFDSPLAWYDHPASGNDLGEVADICGNQDVIVSAGAHTYMVQTEFSNLQGDCVSAPPVLNLSTPASGAGPSLPFNGTLTIQSSVSPFTLSGYRGTIHFTSSDPLAVLPADYTFVQADAGSHQFSFTLGTLGNQTISVIDTHSAGFTGSATVNVNTTPDLAITKSHTGNFSVGQTGATYTITVSNVGHGPTSGTVTVVDSLPSGLTATAISGTGWSCTLGTLTCTRADALAATSSYPAITLTVNVAANAPSLVTNTATVSGGGETNIANNSASDPTSVLAPDLLIFKQHDGVINGSFFQGEIGATYRIFVSNNGNLASFGTITVVDTLPTGLTATAISGSGWTCTLATLTCTRSDVLVSGNTAETITVTVNVAPDAPANVVNSATVSGGGEVNTGNDLSQDPTIILPPPHPDLAPFMNHSFNNFVQGQTGIYRIDISNVGTANTSGTVNVSDTLPTGLTATDMSGVGWTCTVGATSSCTRSDALLFNDSYAPIFLTVAIAANAPTSVVNTVTVSGGGDTNAANNTFNDPTSIAVPLVDLTVQIFGPFFIVQGQTNLSENISVRNFGNVPSSGTVTLVNTLSTGLNATSIGGQGWSCTLNNLTCMRSDALNANAVYPDILVAFNVANNAPPGAGSYQTTVSGGGDGAPGNNTSNLAAQISPMFQILPLTTNATVNAGQPAVFSFQVSINSSAAGAVTLSCSGLPAASTCSFNQPSVTSSAFINMTVNTTASSTVVGNDGTRSYPKLWLVAMLLALAMLFTFSLSSRSPRLKRLRLALGVTGFLLVLALAGCGGGGGGTQTVVTHTAGTPPGTYALTITGTGSNGPVTQVVNLTVR